MMFDVVLDWLQALPKTEFTASVMADIRAHHSLGRGERPSDWPERNAHRL